MKTPCLLLTLAATLASAQPSGTGRLSPTRSAVYQTGSEFIVPQFIVGGEWTSTIKLTNNGTADIPTSNVWLIDNAGQPLTATFQISSGATITDTGFTFRLQAGDTIELTFTGGPDAKFGHARIDSNACPQTASCSLYAEVTLRNTATGRPYLEAIFPLEAASALQYMLWDHRNGYWTVLYLVNDNGSPATVSLEFRDYVNKTIGTYSLTMPGGGAQIMKLHEIMPQTIGTYGNLIIRGQNAVVATGLRITPSNTFTPIRAFVAKQ